MKYKVGDKVKVRDDLLVGNCYGYYAYCGDMVNFRGKTVTIKTVAYDFYRIEEDRQTSCWTDAMFEDVNENDVDDNDEAETAKFRAFLEEVANLDADGYNKEFSMLSNIISRGYAPCHNDLYDYDYDEAVDELCNFYRTFTPIKKEKKKMMTKAEIEDALGYKIEIVEE